ncbi:hypothetical protein AB0L35_04700 [Streptomyces sp. NPDC052309]|uniref:hypothetical protein n=1 Tax=Streptomyces sp. NPDC052309 TaxID=3155421 RepID=UPI003418CDB9
MRNLSPIEVEEFAQELRSKQLLALSFHLPVTYKWLEVTRPQILREFQDISTFSRLTEGDAAAKQLVTFVRECRDFYDDIPKSLPDVAQLEFLLMSARKEQENRARRPVAEASAPPPFSWDSLYWRPSSTSVARFSVDAFAILLGKKKLTDESGPTWVVLAPAASGRVPTVLRITAPAYHLLEAMKEPVSGRHLREHAQQHGLNVSAPALQALLTTLHRSGVIDSHYVKETDAEA